MKMNTPICDFVRRYAQSDALRLHMPGHKGRGPLGVEALDITEIDGADSLYHAGGIIRESEENASRLFGAQTFYSTEGSSQCIRAMLHLALLHARKQGRNARICAGRNAHKTFLSAAALLDLDVVWLYGRRQDSYLSCKIDAEALDAALEREKPVAVYLTSPDYLGNLADLRALAGVCRRHGALLLVDNAHGAYLKFLPESTHPIDLGADLCCDSAHKTLPVLTGGAYLHLSAEMSRLYAHQARSALSLFGSTSPSYLILQSLDAANPYLSRWPKPLADFAASVASLKGRLREQGYALLGDEPLKLTLAARPYGYTGTALAAMLLEEGVVCEFYDPDFVVMMLTTETGEEGLERLEEALRAIPRRDPLPERCPCFGRAERVMSPREALLSPSEVVPVAESVGRVLASPSVSCPPAVPIVVCGERIEPWAIQCFNYYGVESCAVVAK